MKAVFRHELSLYYHGISAYVFGAFLLLFTGIGALIYNLNASVANFEYVLSTVSIVLIIVIPVLTMRILAEERKQRTDQLLYSLPISTADVVLGKFFALAVVFAIPIIIICAYPLLFKQFGDVYLPTSYGCICAFFFMGLALIAVGMFISSLTESQGLAAGICAAVVMFNYFSTTLADYVSSSSIGTLITIIVLMLLLAGVIFAMTKSGIAAIIFGAVTIAAAMIIYFVNSSLLEGLLPAVMNKLSLFERFNTFVNGVFDLTGLVYYISVAAFFLFLCGQSFEKRRYNA